MFLSGTCAIFIGDGDLSFSVCSFLGKQCVDYSINCVPSPLNKVTFQHILTSVCLTYDIGFVYIKNVTLEINLCERPQKKKQATTKVSHALLRKDTISFNGAEMVSVNVKNMNTCCCQCQRKQKSMKS